MSPSVGILERITDENPAPDLQASHREHSVATLMQISLFADTYVLCMMALDRRHPLPLVYWSTQPAATAGCLGPLRVSQFSIGQRPEVIKSNFDNAHLSFFPHDYLRTYPLETSSPRPELASSAPHGRVMKNRDSTCSANSRAIIF